MYNEPCGNTQAEIDRDTKAYRAIDSSMRTQEIYGRNDDVSDAISPDFIQAQIDHYEWVVEQLLDANQVADRSGLKHWLPAQLNKYKWAKDLRDERGLPLLTLYKIGDLDADKVKLIKSEARTLASIIVG